MTPVKQRRSIISLMLGIITILALVAPPAAADAKSPTIALFRGRAVIGEPIEKNTKGECTKVVGGGLNDPVVLLPAPGVGPAKNRCYGFEAPSVATVESRCTALVWNAPMSNVENCVIEASGNVGAVGTPKGIQLGAWCGLSRGWNGSGSFVTSGVPGKPGVSVTLKDLGWLPAPAGAVVTGSWFDPTDPGKKGSVLGKFTLHGSDNFGNPLLIACLTANGAHAFDVSGVVVLL
ncbi:MAG TPA: hypothetical protein VGA69_02535 [Nitriliruptorales bacterium]